MADAGAGARRILHVSHSGQPGGSNTVLCSLLRHAPPGTRSWCVFGEDGPARAQAAALGAAVAVVETGRARQPWRAPGALRGLRAAIRAAAPDVVLAHVAKAHPYAAAAARLEGVPEAWWQHQHPRQDRALQELAGRVPAATVLCSARWVAEEQRRRFPRTRAEVVAPGIEVAGEIPARAHVEGPATIGIVGRLQRWKRVELALDAFAQALAQEPGLRLEVVGDAWAGVDANYPAELRGRARALGVDAAVTFTGHLPDAAARMARYDLLVHCAADEPFGLVLVEALARGVPVVAPARGGPAEIVRDGVDGLLVDVEDPRAPAAALVALARDPARRARMGAAGRERALSEFSAAAMARRVYALLDGVAGRP